MKVPTRVKATLLRKLGQMIEDSGGARGARGARGDVALSDWLDAWFTEPLPELNGATPSELPVTEDGHERVEVLLERMSGGLSA